MKKQFTQLFVLCIVFVFSACKKETNTGNNALNKNETSLATNTTAPALLTGCFGGITPSQDYIAASVAATDYFNEHPAYNDFISQLLAATPAPCDGNTPFFQWINEQFTGWTANDFNFLNNFRLDIIAGQYSLYFENDQSKQIFGKNGEYNTPIYHTLKDLKRFWNINTTNLVVSAWHGSTLADSAKLYMVNRFVYHIPDASSKFYAGYVAHYINLIPEFMKGNHPVFSLNGFAYAGSTSLGIPPKIVLGDGIFEDYDAIGFGDVAPQAVLAHEFGHHIQIQNNLYTTTKTAEATRRLELMADAFAAYFLSHARGAAMQWKRVKEFLQVSYNIGDCFVTDPAHHGTPTQRMAASEWGYNLANDAHKQGHIYTVQEFDAMFEAALPGILNN